MTDLEDGRSEAAGIPTRAGLDRTAGLLLEGYPFLADCRRLAAGIRRPGTAAPDADPTPQRVPHRQPPPCLTRHRHASARPTGAADCEPATRATQAAATTCPRPAPIGGRNGSRSGSARYLWLDRGRDRAAGALRQVLLGPTLGDVRHCGETETCNFYKEHRPEYGNRRARELDAEIEEERVTFYGSLSRRTRATSARCWTSRSTCASGAASGCPSRSSAAGTAVPGGWRAHHRP